MISEEIKKQNSRHSFYIESFRHSLSQSRNKKLSLLNFSLQSKFASQTRKVIRETKHAVINKSLSLNKTTTKKREIFDNETESNVSKFRTKLHGFSIELFVILFHENMIGLKKM